MEITPQLNRWYCSTIDGVTQGKVIDVEPDGIVTVRLSNTGHTDWWTLAEFRDSWQEN